VCNNVSFSSGACSVALQGSASTASSLDDSGGRQSGRELPVWPSLPERFHTFYEGF